MDIQITSLEVDVNLYLKAGSCLPRTRYLPYTMNKKTAESTTKEP